MKRVVWGSVSLAVVAVAGLALARTGATRAADPQANGPTVIRVARRGIGSQVKATVLRNLLENAVKYSLPDSRAIRVMVSESPEGAAIRVTDDGAGIPAEDAERIFEPFFRVDRSRSKESGGYGLGLSICKRVMEAHGGRISVERSNGRGASFVLTFPKSA